MNEIQIVNKHHKPKDEGRSFYIGRPSVLGNPFSITELWSREFVIDLYEKLLKKKIAEEDEATIQVLNHIGSMVVDNSGKPVKLVCWCAPQKCHGDVIKRVIMEAIKNG